MDPDGDAEEGWEVIMEFLIGVITGVVLGGVLATLLVPRAMSRDAQRSARDAVHKLMASEAIGQVRTLINDARAKKKGSRWRLTRYVLLSAVMIGVAVLGGFLGLVTGDFVGRFLTPIIANHVEPWTLGVIVPVVAASVLVRLFTVERRKDGAR